ncbi:helix-turn-helix domain-containing protein [Psychrobacillus glaciei]|nr:helix-turn-helix domain-containing protein [Psychrobacillus glaciei]
MTNQEIANLCATSRGVVNRMLNDIKKSDIITLNKGYNNSRSKLFTDRN